MRNLGNKPIMVGLLWWLLVSFAQAVASDFGPASGERLVYNVHWMGAPGGKAVMEFSRQNENNYHIAVTVESIGLVDLVHSIRDRFEVTGLLTANGPLADVFSKVMRKNKKEKKVELIFHRQEGYAKLTNGEDTPGERIEDLSDGINDPLTTFYGVRAQQELKIGESYINGMIDGKNRYMSIVRVEDGGSVVGPLGWFDTLEVSPTLASSELFHHAGNMTIWLTKDNRRLPIRIKSRVRVGSIQADLVAYDDGRGEHRELKVQ